MGEYFAAEQPLLRPLPQEPFETGRLFSLRVDRYAQVSVRTNRYSVPVRLIGRTVRVMLHASEVVVYDSRVEVARHERCPCMSTPPSTKLCAPLLRPRRCPVRWPGAGS
ncbi:Mu transposase domain-containing protein [Streptomyces luteogriseus]|uniref:Mu transposase domain-containing protein n=1 Tax=Streptomyces luteogriseus TaxID=68233 RepID=UPI003FA39155